jgi:Flp pilus assembly protein TadG
MQIRRKPPHQRDERRGAALVETAIVLPIFFMVVLGIIEFGRAFMVAQLLNNAAREGTRIAIMAGSTNSEVETAVKGFVTGSVGCAAVDVDVDITVTAATGNPTPSPPNDVSVAMKRDLCTVVVSVPFTKVNYMPSKFLISASLTGQSAMRHE